MLLELLEADRGGDLVHAVLGHYDRIVDVCTDGEMAETYNIPFGGLPLQRMTTRAERELALLL